MTLHLPSADEKVDIFIIVDDNFFEGARVALCSLLRRSDLPIGVVHALYHQALSPVSPARLRRLRELWPRVSLHDCSHLHPWAAAALNRSALVSLLKFECFHHVRSGTALYIDADVLVLRSIRPMLEELRQRSVRLAAVENTSRAAEFREYRFDHFPANAGLFLYRASSEAESLRVYADLAKEVEARANKLVQDPPMVCQPIFNVSLGRTLVRYLAAPMFYNYRDLSSFVAHKNEVKVLHYVSRTTASEKPWSSRALADDPAHHEWWKMQRRLSFGGTHAA